MRRFETHLIVLALLLSLHPACRRSTPPSSVSESVSGARSERVYVTNSLSGTVQSSDTWKSEALAGRAAEQLEVFRTKLVSGDAAGVVAALVSADFRFTPLLPEELATVFDDGSVRIFESLPNAIDRSRIDSPASEFAGEISNFRERYSALERVDLKIVDLTLEANHFWTKVLVQTSGTIETGQRAAKRNMANTMARERGQLLHGAAGGRRFHRNPEPLWTMARRLHARRVRR